jgi:cytochrome c-type biogenesis protein CcmH/NrfG
MKNERDKNSDKKEQFDSFGSDDDETEAVYSSDNEEDEDEYDDEDYEDDEDEDYEEDEDEYSDNEKDNEEDEDEYDDEDYEDDEDEDYEEDENSGNLRKRLGVVAGIVSVIVVIALIVVWAGGISPSNTGKLTAGTSTGGAGSSQSTDVAGYEAKVKANPNDIQALYGLGHSYNNTGNYSKGEETFRKIVSLQPKNSEAYTDLGISLEGQGKYDEALQQYDEALKVDPKYSFALWSKAAFYAGVKKDYDEALRLYEEVLTIIPAGSQEYQQVQKNIEQLKTLKSQPTVPSSSN